MNLKCSEKMALEKALTNALFEIVREGNANSNRKHGVSMKERLKFYQKTKKDN